MRIAGEGKELGAWNKDVGPIKLKKSENETILQG